MVSVTASNFGSGASGGRSFSSGNHANSVVTEEGLTVVLVKGNICDQTVSCENKESRPNTILSRWLY